MRKHKPLNLKTETFKSSELLRKYTIKYYLDRIMEGLKISISRSWRETG